MEHLQLNPAKLLYFATELFKRKAITDQERVQLKELIIQEDRGVYTCLEHYERSNNEQEFSDQLIQRVRSKHSGRATDGEARR